MQAREIACPNCGANVSAPDTGRTRCRYCGSELRVAATRAPQVAPVPTSSAGRRGALVAAIAAVVSLSGVVTALFAVGQATDAGPAGGGAEPMVPAALRDALQPAEHLTWDHVEGMPWFFDAGGRAAILGRTRRVLDGDRLAIEAFSAADGAPLWRIEGLGAYTGGYRAVHAVPVGDAVVVSDPAGAIHVHDAATGARRSTTASSDQVEELCPDPAGAPTRVFVVQVDERHGFFDPGTATRSEGARPKHCRGFPWDGHAARGGKADPDVSEQRPPRRPGLDVRRVFVEDGVRTALAVKDPGTPVPHALGLDAKGSVLWDTVLVDGGPEAIRSDDHFGALAGGAFHAVIPVGTEDGWELVSLASATGEVRWRLRLRPIFAVDDIAGIVATPTRVFVGRMASVEIYDAADGRLVATLGRETYDGASP